MRVWSAVLPSSDLEPGQVVEVSHGGHDILLYRTPGGDCHAVTGYCPHMSNYMPNGLAPGDSLDCLLQNGVIRCPFHGWCFNTAGQAVSIPPGQRVPPAVRKGRPVLRGWPVRESGGQVEIADSESPRS